MFYWNSPTKTQHKAQNTSQSLFSYFYLAYILNTINMYIDNGSASLCRPLMTDFEVHILVSFVKYFIFS